MGSASLHIDLDALAANWRALDRKSAQGVETAAVVKANGYGLGADVVGKTLARAGARSFFIAVADEGVVVRRALGDAATICVFGGHMEGDTDLIRSLNLVPMLNSVEQITRHFETLPDHPFGIQLDSGMNRLGMEPAEWQAVREIVMGQGPELIMSHLACADEPDHAMNERQLASFIDMTEGLDVPRSFSATGGILLGERYHFDVTRPGIGIYGGRPFNDARPVVRVDIPVVQVRTVDAGESVGYANSYIADTPRLVATIAAGYADGINRHISNKGFVYHGGIKCPLLGRVSMDLLTVDVTHLPEVPDSLQLLSDAQTVDDVADIAGTIGYEVLTNLGRRYRRTYTGGGA